ncbi:MAG TPA: pirin family protein [Oligoflexia bacterium]|nr:pirin family protein [Oligoflexia bacterium]HMP27885.1 pirin family protein [Oligoflexia bacterium]
MTAQNNSLIEIHNGGEFHWVGDGFPVRSIFGYNDFANQISPFLLLDYAAPYNFKPSDKRRGVAAHPHRGFETVTIVFQGELEHRDSLGGGGLIGAGDVQWMTAGSGLLHQEYHGETFSKKGGTFEVIQLWVNLPAQHKNAKPNYQTLLKSTIPTVSFENGGGEMRIIAGNFDSARGPAKTFTPINLWELSLEKDRQISLPLGRATTRAIFLISGSLLINGAKLMAEQLAIVKTHDDQIQLTASESSKALILNGEPINEPIVGYGPFVMNTQEEIRQAFADFKSGRFGEL